MEKSGCDIEFSRVNSTFLNCIYPNVTWFNSLFSMSILQRQSFPVLTNLNLFS